MRTAPPRKMCLAPFSRNYRSLKQDVLLPGAIRHLLTGRVVVSLRQAGDLRAELAAAVEAVAEGKAAQHELEERCTSLQDQLAATSRR